jgi:hypothetical protein
MEETIGVGLLMTVFGSPVPCANDDCVAMLDTELLLVGLPGRTGMKELGEAGKPVDGCLESAGMVGNDILPVVGVGVGVDALDALEEAAAVVVLIIEGVWWRFCDASGPWYLSPSSPGAKVMAEQNPSEEVMRSVRPSLDHVRSVNVAKCKLLTMHNGFCCCVSYM